MGTEREKPTKRSLLNTELGKSKGFEQKWKRELQTRRVGVVDEKKVERGSKRGGRDCRFRGLALLSYAGQATDGGES